MLEQRIELSDGLLIGAGRVALVVEYDGAAFHGWQNQKGRVRSIGGCLEAAVSRVANEPVTLVCAGRTDAGVHACYQVAHFDVSVTRSLRSWVLGVNSALPADVRVHWAGQVDASFSARFSAKARRYRYLMLSRETPPALMRNRVAWSPQPMDADAMHEGAQHLLGEQDFSAFRAAGCQARTPWRNVSAISVAREGPFLVLDITANAFLHHMVRNIAGTLMRVGRGDAQPCWVAAALKTGDRREAGMTAPAAGLYLVDVLYPSEAGLPRPLPGPLWVRQSG